MNTKLSLEEVREWNRREAEEIARIEAQYRNEEFLDATIEARIEALEQYDDESVS